MADGTTRVAKKKRAKKKPAQYIAEEKKGDTKKNYTEPTIVQCNKPGVTIKPVFSKDLRHIICACGSNILVIRRKTGITENVFNKHKYDVHSLFINENDPSQIISCSNKEVIIWDYIDLDVFKKYHLQMDTTGFVMSSINQKFGFFKVPIQTEKKKRNKKETLIRCRLKNCGDKKELGQISKSKNSLVIDKGQNNIAFIHKEKLMIHNISKDITHVLMHDEINLTCVAFHPNQNIVATGNKDGKIVVWYEYKADEAVSMILHWHNAALNDLIFTNNGNYLMSGGREGVLVVWQLETQHKSFIPRIGGVIEYLFQTNDDQYIGTVLDCNMIKVLSALDSKLLKTIKFLATAHELTVGLKYHPESDCLVLNGRTDGVIQFYQPNQDSVKLNLDVVGENLVSSLEERYIYPTRVEKMDFSSDGVWMATVDVREDRLLPVERKLKFWKYSDQDKSYSLNTLVDPPHDDAVYSLIFRPPNQSSSYPYTVITTSKDGFLKAWVLSDETTNKGEKVESWQTHLIGNYGKDSCKHACFSHDGSILAVLFSEITLWDPDTLTLQTSLAWNLPNDAIKSMTFACHSSSQYLLANTNNYLIVWDIKTCSIKWQMEAEVDLLVADPYSNYVSAFIWFQESRVLHLYLFDPSTPHPVAILCNVTKDKDEINAAIYTPKLKSSIASGVWSETGRLYYLTKNGDVKNIRSGEEKSVETTVTNQNSDEVSNFESIFGTLPKDQSVSGKQDNISSSAPVGNPAAVIIRKMMSTPAHVLPTADILCQAFLKSLLIQKEECLNVDGVHKTNEDLNNIDEEIQDSDIEDDEVNKKQSTQIEDGVINNDHSIQEYNLPKYDFSFIHDVFV